MTAANETLFWSTKHTHKNISVTNPALLDLGPMPFWALLSVGLPWGGWRPFSSGSALCWHVNKCREAITQAGDCQRPLLSATPAKSRVLPCVSPKQGSPLLPDWRKAAQDPPWCHQAQPAVITQKWFANLELCAHHCKNLLSSDLSETCLLSYTQQRRNGANGAI